MSKTRTHTDIIIMQTEARARRRRRRTPEHFFPPIPFLFESIMFLIQRLSEGKTKEIYFVQYNVGHGPYSKGQAPRRILRPALEAN